MTLVAVLALASIWTLAVLAEGFTGTSEAGSTLGTVARATLTVPPLLIGFLLVGLRPLNPPSGDTAAYVRTYMQLQDFGSSYALGHRLFGNSEIGFWPMQSILHTLLEPRGWLIANYLLVVVLTLLAYRQLTKQTPYAAVLFASTLWTYFLVYVGNGMRQSIAIPLAFLSVGYAQRRRYIAALAAILLAVAFHWSALLVFGLLLGRFIPGRRAALVALPGLALIVGQLPNVFLIPTNLNLGFFADRYSLYFINGVESTIGNPWSSTNLWIVLIVYISVVLSSDLADEDARRLATLSCYFLCIVMLTLGVSEVWVRSLVYVIFLSPLLFAQLMLSLKLKRHIGGIAYAAFFMFTFFGWLYSASAQATLGFSMN